MNYYEIGQALESAAGTIKKMPYSFVENAEIDVEDKYKAMLKTVEDAQEFSRKCIKDLTALDKAHVALFEEIVAKTKERVATLKRCFEDVEYSDLRRVDELSTAMQKLRSLDPADLEIIAEILSRRSKHD